eukprot:TRINITY_DN1475_c0_g1_i1.p1 TRINITY_DN1475_c0_g1~~TRINITY_DN1475_c0_g1_i1.p1  ORF type:complete len:170 (-),score=41.59 TRINITY_DN1475_c0_g1_i1:108-617(-)
MNRFAIVPDVLDSEPTLTTTLKVSYGDRELKMGEVLDPSEAKSTPSLHWGTVDGKLYTLLMVDPDAPSRENPTKRCYRHWGVVNIPGNKIGEGKIVTEYMGPAPPPNSGTHRYVFLVYEQAKGLKLDTHNLGERGGFNVPHFMKESGLKDPLAAFMFHSQNSNEAENSL